jgi:hypothetical protein
MFSIAGLTQQQHTERGMRAGVLRASVSPYPHMTLVQAALGKRIDAKKTREQSGRIALR